MALGKTYEVEIRNLWDLPTLPYDDLPTVQQLLLSCDLQVLCAVMWEDRMLYSRNQPGGSLGDGLSSRAGFCARLNEILCEMLAADLRFYQEGEWVLLPLEAYSVDPSSLQIVRRVVAPRVLLRSVDPNPFSWGVRCHCRYSDVPWEEVLSYRVWMGSELCSKERYMMLSSALWEVLYSDLADQKPACPQGVEMTPELPAFDPWGLDVQRDFEDRYRSKMQSRVDFMNEKAWEAFCSERVQFAQTVLGVA